MPAAFIETSCREIFFPLALPAGKLSVVTPRLGNDHHQRIEKMEKGRRGREYPGRRTKDLPWILGEGGTICICVYFERRCAILPCQGWKERASPGLLALPY